MPYSPHPTGKYAGPLVWTATAILVFIGLAAASRRFMILLAPPVGNPSFAAAAALDAGFAAHRLLTLVHVLPAFFFYGTYSFSVRRGYSRTARRRASLVGASAARARGRHRGVRAHHEFHHEHRRRKRNSRHYSLRSFALVFLGLGYLNIRRHRVDLHRQWMIRAFGVALGVATTRPIIGAFFAARRLSPHEFFGAAFWLGFTTTLLAAEAIHFTEARLPNSEESSASALAANPELSSPGDENR